MSTPVELVDRYIAMWNETDPDRRRAIIRALWSEDCSHVDPNVRVDGREAIDGLVGSVQARFPDHRFRRTSGVESQDGELRFSWALTAPGGGPMLSGRDLGAVAADGRLRRITAVFDAAPAARPLG